MQWLFQKLLPHIDVQITKRIIAFHDVMLRRQQISSPTPEFGITADYTEDQVPSANRSLQRYGQLCRQLLE